MAKYVKTEEGYISKYNIGLATVEEIVSIASATSTAKATADTAQATADLKMNADNPVGTGSFSMGRKEGSFVGENSHAEGFNTEAFGKFSHAEGKETRASGWSSHAEGNRTIASGANSHAEGYNTGASGDNSHAEGYDTGASGLYSHAEGSETTASGWSSHAEGNRTIASGANSHAEGISTKASKQCQHVQGQYNIIEDFGNADSYGKYAHIVGNGTGLNERSNAHTLDWDGNAWFAGDVYVGSTSGTNKDDGSKKLATEDYVNNNVDATLTKSGQAADAAKVGEELRSLSGKIVTDVAEHNTGTDAHSDIRMLISGLTDRLNALADSDDTTLDQLSEVVAYIKSNRTLIEAITTNKVSVSDIIDNLTTNVPNKPLSAAQGVALKALIDAITIPTALPNPNALTFSGAVTGSYDGSAPLSVEIPSGGGGSSWETVIDTTLTEEAGIDTGEMPGKTEVMCLFAVPKHTAVVQQTNSSKAFGASLSGFNMAGASYGKVGCIYCQKIRGHAVQFAGSSDTTSGTPSIDTTSRTPINMVLFKPNSAADDIPLKLAVALPSGTTIKVFVR